MKKGDRIIFQGRSGVVAEARHVTPGMVDLRMEGEQFIRRAPVGEIQQRGTSARQNPAPRRRNGRGRSAFRHNPEGEEGVPLTRQERRERRESLRKKREKGDAEESYRIAQLKAAGRRAEGISERKFLTGIQTSADIQQVLRRDGAALYTQQDPPRLSGQGTTYCGNPIDGTAYYMILAGQKRYQWEWVKRAHVEKAARDAGRSWDIRRVQSVVVEPIASSGRPTGRSESVLNAILHKEYQLDPDRTAEYQKELQRRTVLRHHAQQTLKASENELRPMAKGPGIPAGKRAKLKRDVERLRAHFEKEPEPQDVIDFRISERVSYLAGLSESALAKKAESAGIDIGPLAKERAWTSDARRATVDALAQQHAGDIRAQTLQELRWMGREARLKSAEEALKTAQDAVAAQTGEIERLAVALRPVAVVEHLVRSGRVRLPDGTVVDDPSTRVRHGETLHVDMPGADSPELDRYFTEEYRPALAAERGQEVAEELGDVAALTQQRKRFDPKMGKLKVARIKELPGPKPDPSQDYFQVDPASGRRVFYKIHKSGDSANRARLRQFQAFATRRFTYSVRPGRPLNLLKVLQLVSHGDIHRDVALLFLRSGGVSLRTVAKDEDTRGAWFKTVTDPSMRIEEDVQITVGLPAKADDEFFSWLPTVLPVRTETVREGETNVSPLRMSPCLSEADEKVRVRLSSARAVLGGLQRGFQGTRFLFHRLATDPETLVPEDEARRVEGQTMRNFASLANGFAATLRWWRRLRDANKVGNPAAERLFEILSAPDSPLDLSWEGDFEMALDRAWGEKSLVKNVASQEMYVSALQAEVEGRGEKARNITKEQKFLGLRKAMLKAIRDSGKGKGAVEDVVWRAPLDFLLLKPEKRPHPMVDMLVYYLPGSFDDVRKGELASSYNEAQKGVGAMYRSFSDGAAEPVKGAEPAWSFFKGISMYSIGEDPDTLREKFPLQQAPGWSIPEDKQRDINWTIQLIIGQVFPALKRDRGMSAGAAAYEAAMLLLLAKLYYDTGGYLFAGPLDPHSAIQQRIYATEPTEIQRLLAGPKRELVKSIKKGKRYHHRRKGVGAVAARIPVEITVPDATGTPVRMRVRPLRLKKGVLRGWDESTGREVNIPVTSIQALEMADPYASEEGADGVLRRTDSYLRNQEARLMGGSTGLGVMSSASVFKTYNPLLFQLTRLFWSGSSRWSPGILGHPSLVTALDAVGRYGFFLRNTQLLAQQTTSPDELLERGLEEIEPAEAAKYAGIAQATYRGSSTFNAKYKTFALLWPLGSTLASAKASVRDWVADPISALRDAKRNVDLAIVQAHSLGTRGLPVQVLPGKGKKLIKSVLAGKRELDPSLPAFTTKERAARARLSHALAEQTRAPFATLQQLEHELPRQAGESDEAYVARLKLTRRWTEEGEAAALKRFQTGPATRRHREPRVKVRAGVETDPVQKKALRKKYRDEHGARWSDDPEVYASYKKELQGVPTVPVEIEEYVGRPEWVTTPLPSVPETGVYDQATVARLTAALADRPPSRSVPFLFGGYQVLDPKTKTVRESFPIWPRSALHQVEEAEKTNLREMYERIDSAIKALERQHPDLAPRKKKK